ncbi:MAG: hypothetical protein JRI33_02495 [Deltaproteobacteria bacterium]|nr:hypothetical protein [Deltaproteobacteria bacterium]MBW2049964.1 hypothetical protein [Deltaproteobacteria bacterium]
MKKRKKDPASFQYGSCFTGDELLGYREGGLPAAKRAEIFYHLNVEKCERCRHLLLIAERGDYGHEPAGAARKIIERLKNTVSRPPVPVPEKIREGQIWTTTPQPRSAGGMAPPVLVISAGNGEKSPDNIIRVIPVSFDTQYGLSGETFVLDKHNPLNYPVLLEIFNERPMPAGNLDEYRGLISPDEMKRIIGIRARFLNGNVAEPDEEYLAWKEKEIKMAECLSFPLNEFPGGEGKHLKKDVEIPVMAYRKAAATEEGELSEVNPHVLMKTNKLFLGIVQVRDRFLLRFASKDKNLKPPSAVLVDTRSIPLEKKGPGLFEAVLGYAEHMPDRMDIKMDIGGAGLVFNVRYTRRRE